MDFAVNDRVAYSVQFLRSIGASHTDLANLRGEVKHIKDFRNQQIVTVKWNDGHETRVIGNNLAIVGPNRRFSNVD